MGEILVVSVGWKTHGTEGRCRFPVGFEGGMDVMWLALLRERVAYVFVALHCNVALDRQPIHISQLIPDLTSLRTLRIRRLRGRVCVQDHRVSGQSALCFLSHGEYTCSLFRLIHPSPRLNKQPRNDASGLRTSTRLQFPPVPHLQRLRSAVRPHMPAHRSAQPPRQK